MCQCINPEQISNATDAPGDVLGQQFCDLNFDNHVHGDAHIGRINVKRMWQ